VYLSHFGLTEPPFGITPDTHFICSLRSHQEALNTLLLALSGGEGFVKIVGEVGTGKTLLCRRLLQTLETQNAVTAYLPNPLLDADTLVHFLADELSIDDASGLDQFHLLRRINLRLLDLARMKKRVVVCIDEAQAMPLPTLEALRLLSNIETERRKLLHIVLFGQPELDVKLAGDEVRQIRQRIAFHYRLAGIDRDELAGYLVHRLRVAGFADESPFRPDAVRALNRASGGAPRLVNILAHKCLLAAFGEGGRSIGRRHVRRAAADTEGARGIGYLGWW
jgi:MSHA biogenesis protein MshM